MVAFGSILSNASSAENAGGLVLIENKVVTSDSQIHIFSGLNGDSDTAYFMIGTIISNAISNAHILLEPNNITTNQLSVSLEADGAGTSTATDTTLEFGIVIAGDQVAFQLHLFSSKSINSIARTRFGTSMMYHPNFTFLRTYGFNWNETATNITSLEVQLDAADALGNGSQLVLYKWRDA